MANKDPRMRAKPSKTAAAQSAASKVAKRSSALKPVTGAAVPLPKARPGLSRMVAPNPVKTLRDWSSLSPAARAGLIERYRRKNPKI